MTSISERVKNIPERAFSTTKSLKLPSGNYGPFCLKILNDFMEFHELADLPLPEPGLSNHEALSRIFDIMAYSMGQKRREALMVELEEYKKGLSSDFL
jgi:hypothetical protein